MNDLIKPVADTFAFNSKMVSLAVTDLPNHDATKRRGDGTGNSISFLVGHVSSSRYGILKMLGIAHANPFADQFGAGVGSTDGRDYPSIGELSERWSQLARKLDATLESLTTERLLAEPATSYPTPDKTVRGAIAFIAWHETYHLGQIGMIRTKLGYPSIRSRLLAAQD